MRVSTATAMSAAVLLFVVSVNAGMDAKAAGKPADVQTSDQNKTQIDNSVKDKSAPEQADLKKTGDQFAKSNQMEKAVDSYKKFLEQNAGDTAVARIAVKVGEYCLTKKQYAEAERYFTIANTKKNDQYVQALLARAFLHIGKEKEALEMAESVANAPASSGLVKPEARREALRTLGDVYLRRGMAERASGCYDRYIKAGGVKNADIAFASAWSLESYPAKAKLKYEENTKIYPADCRNYIHLGLILSRNKATLNKADMLIRKAEEVAGSDGDAWMDIAAGYANAGKTDNEIEALNRSIQADTGNVDARVRISVILVKKGEYAGAIKILEQARAIAPGNMMPVVLLSQAYIKTGRLKDAVDMLEKAKKVMPNDPQVRKQLSDAYSALNQDQKALDEIKALIDMKRDNEYLLSYANLLLKTGKLEDAANTIQDIRATDPENVDALMTFAAVLRAQKKFDEAVEAYKEVSTLDPANAKALYERAETYIMQTKYKWAEQFYKRAIEADPKMALAELGLARLALVYKDNQAYTDHLNKAVAIDPGNPAVKQELENGRKRGK
jgi:tetratricopeptide (TPR) repeat protein